MNSSTILYRHTDFISDRQYITYWGFDTFGLKKNEDSGNYSMPVRKALFGALSKIARSRNKRIRERSFTIFMGDYGSTFQYFGIGIRHSTFRMVKDIFESYFSNVIGYEHEDYDRMPYIPFIPVYRYINGKIIKYTYEEKLAGRVIIDDMFDTGLLIKYRMFISAEAYDLKQKYQPGY